MLAAGLIGYFLHPAPEPAPETPAEPQFRPAAALPDRGDAATIASLRQRVRELEARLADGKRAEELAVSNALAKAEARGPGGRRPGPPGRERLEELRKRDPARFAQMTNRFAKMHQERKNRQAARTSFLASVDTSHMSAKSRETHDAYQELLARREELDEKMHESGLSEDARHELMDELHSVDRQLRTLGDSERNVLLGEVAQAIGMQGDAAAELVETVGEVFEATQGGGNGPPGPPPQGVPPGE